MPSIKEYNVKLNRLANSEKMTRTMKLVAMSKLYRAHEAQKNAKIYAKELTGLISRLSAAVESTAHPLLCAHTSTKNVQILVICSDRGLCGAFNNNLNKHALKWINEHKALYNKIEVVCCGKRSFFFFKKLNNVKHYYKGVTATPDFAAASQIGKDLQNGFLSGETDEVFLAYNTFHSPLSQTVHFEKILPIESKSVIAATAPIRGEYLFEPRETELLELLIPRYLYFRIYFALLENSAGEHGARMTAMDNASKNAAELIDHYALLRNRARQASITKELIEIISGAEALK